MKLYIEDDKGERMLCREVKTLSIPDSILIFKTMTCLRKETVDEFCVDMNKSTGHTCVLLDGSIELVAQIAPSSVNDDIDLKGR